MSEPQPEFSKVIELGDPGRAPKIFSLTANEDQCRKVAARLGALSISHFEGEVRISTTKTEIFVDGAVKAQMVRECVASLEPEFDIEFTRILETKDEDETESEEDWRLPEVHLGDDIDIGELLVQQLSLAMDPFPRKEGATSLADIYAKEEKVSPFAVLQGVVKKSDDNQ